MSAPHTTSALLVMDVQMSTVTRYIQGDEFFAALHTAIDAAHAAAIPVIYGIVAFRPGAPEISPNNKIFAAVKERQVNSPAPIATAEVHPAFAPQSTDIVVTKRRISTFSGSDLDLVLRSQGITHLVLGGIATSGVVLSTLREAADKDYQLTVLADCCADNDDEVHRVLLSKIFPQQAEVRQAIDWVSTLA